MTNDIIEIMMELTDYGKNEIQRRKYFVLQWKSFKGINNEKN